MPDIEDSLLQLAKTVDTINIPQTHVKVLKLFVDTDDRFEDWLDDVTESLSPSEDNPEPWNTILNAKISQLCQRWSDAQVSFQLPSRTTGMTDSDSDINNLLHEALPSFSATAHPHFIHQGKGN